MPRREVILREREQHTSRLAISSVHTPIKVVHTLRDAAYGKRCGWRGLGYVPQLLVARGGGHYRHLTTNAVADTHSSHTPLENDDLAGTDQLQPTPTRGKRVIH